MKPIIVISGPTASGKTALAVELAKKFNSEVVSADSMQIYKGMDIGTAKPTAEEMQGIKHNLIDIAEPYESYSVAQYSEAAEKVINRLHSEGKIPIMAGGTGLYINSVINGLDFSSGNSDEDYRNELWNEAEKYGNAQLHKRLSEIDPESGRRIHENDVRRVIRALEVYKVTGMTMTEYRLAAASAPPKYNAVKIGLDWDRAVLYDRINKRVDLMIRQGLEQEVRGLCSERFLKSTAAQAIGYKEMIAYFDGRMTRPEAIDAIKQGSRNYAKRQISFFGADKDINKIAVTGKDLPCIINETEKLTGGLML